MTRTGRHQIAALGACAFLAQLSVACTHQAPVTAVPRQAASILASSTPADSSVVKGPVNSLQLQFDRPALLNQLTVTGPDGTMPMMVHAAAETAHYSIPLPGLTAGRYTVNWRALVGGAEHQGSFVFTVE